MYNLSTINEYKLHNKNTPIENLLYYTEESIYITEGSFGIIAICVAIIGAIIALIAIIIKVCNGDDSKGSSSSSSPTTPLTGNTGNTTPTNTNTGSQATISAPTIDNGGYENFTTKKELLEELRTRLFTKLNEKFFYIKMNNLTSTNVSQASSAIDNAKSVILDFGKNMKTNKTDYMEHYKFIKNISETATTFADKILDGFQSQNSFKTSKIFGEDNFGAVFNNKNNDDKLKEFIEKQKEDFRQKLKDFIDNDLKPNDLTADYPVGEIQDKSKLDDTILTNLINLKWKNAESVSGCTVTKSTPTTLNADAITGTIGSFAQVGNALSNEFLNLTKSLERLRNALDSEYFKDTEYIAKALPEKYYTDKTEAELKGLTFGDISEFDTTDTGTKNKLVYYYYDPKNSTLTPAYTLSSSVNDLKTTYPTITSQTVEVAPYTKNAALFKNQKSKYYSDWTRGGGPGTGNTNRPADFDMKNYDEYIVFDFGLIKEYVDFLRTITTTIFTKYKECLIKCKDIVNEIANASEVYFNGNAKGVMLASADMTKFYSLNDRIW